MQPTVETLPLSKQLAYAVGQLGWSTLVNIVGVALVLFYLPPDVVAGLVFSRYDEARVTGGQNG